MRLSDAWQSAVCQLYQRRWSNLACLACLGIGIAIVTAIASVLNNVLVRPLPFPEADRLVMVRGENVKENQRDQQTSRIDFLDWSADCRTMDLTAFALGRFDLPHEGGFERLRGLYVSSSFFEVLRIQPYLGVDFRDYDQTGNRRQVMLGTEEWRTRFGADPQVLGHVIQLNTWDAFPNTGSQEYALCGLLPEGMRSLPSSSWIDARGVGPEQRLQFVAPMRMDADDYSHRHYRSVDVLGRLRSGVSVEEAQAEINLLCARIAARYPDANRNWSARVIPLQDYVFLPVRPFVLAGFSAAVLVLLIAIANVAHLLMVQYHQRQSEFAVRAAMGATPWQLLRQGMLEFAILLAGSCALGLAAGRAMTPALLSMAPQQLRWLPTTLQVEVLLMTIGLTCVFAAFVWYAALRPVLSPNLAELLGAEGPSTTRDHRSMQTLTWMSRLQLVATYLLLLGAGVLWMSNRERTRVDPGFDPEGRLTMTVSLPQAKHEWNYNSVFCNDAIDRIRGLPGVTHAAAILGLPMGNSALVGQLTVEGKPLIRPLDLPPTFVRVITDDYFETMGIPMIRGRKFGTTDAIGEIGSNRTAIVNQTMADRCWPGQDPIGRRFKPWPTMHWMEVVGVVGDVCSDGVDRGPVIDIYYPEKLFPQSHISFIVRSRGAPMTLAAEVRDAIRKGDPDAHIRDLMPMNDVIAASMAEQRFGLNLLGSLAVAGIVLAFLGIVVTTAHSLRCRQAEINIRMACGATPWDVLRVILRPHVLSVAFAIAVGMIMGAIITASLELPWRDARFYRQVALLIVPTLLATTSLGTGLLVAARTAFRVAIRI